MWIFTNRGFISMVRHNEKPDCLLVRARDQETLKTLFPEAKIEKTVIADYRYRTVLPASQVATFFEDQIENIDYPKFQEFDLIGSE